MVPSKLWFVRAGSGAAYVNEFVNNGHVAIGWNEIGPVAPTTTDEQLEEAFAKAYPEQRPGTLRIWAGTIKRFARDVKIGDGVITYDPDQRLYFLGDIRSDVEQRKPPLSRWR